MYKLHNLDIFNNKGNEIVRKTIILCVLMNEMFKLMNFLLLNIFMYNLCY